MDYVKKIVEFNYCSEEIRFNKDSTINVKSCPWCEEAHWKLNINPNKGRCGVFRCPKCGHSGSLISLQMKLQKQEYDEALDMLKNSELKSRFKYEVKATSDTVPTASLKRRDAVYRQLIAKGYASQKLAKDLIRRGLGQDQFDWYITVKRGDVNNFSNYVKGPGLIENRHLVSIPGVFGKAKQDEFGKEDTSELFFSFPVNAGYLIPIISHLGEKPAISCMQIRHFEVEEGYPRYSYLTSNNTKLKNGVGVGECNKVHYTRNFWNEDLWNNPQMKVPKTVNLTEGALKADVASVLSGRCFIAVPGVNTIKDLPGELKFLKEKGCERINICFDMDYLDKPQVQQALEKVVEIIKSSDLKPIQIKWDRAFKGIDDYYLHLKSHIGGNK